MTHTFGRAEATVEVEQALLGERLADEQHIAALQDVERAIAALRGAGLLDGAVRRVEYPVAGELDGALLVGSIDLVLAARDQLWVVDFKTDDPPRDVAAHEMPAYAEQVRTYGRLLRLALGDHVRVRAALLFTANGTLHEIPS